MDNQTKPDWLVENDDGSLTINFESRPPKIDGTEVKSLKMREPFVDDQLAADSAGSSSALSEISLISNLCEISPEAVRSMTMRQYSRLQTALSVFIG
jgi:hypothetical protein